MANFVSVLDGGKTNQEGAMRIWRRTSTNGQGPILIDDLKVVQHASGDNTVDVSVGDLFIAYQNYAFYGWSDDATANRLNITNNTSGSPRLDAVVAYVDLAVISDLSNNNPNALKFMVVPGTPAGSPSAPTASVMQAAVGPGNPYYVLAHLSVANNFSIINNANIVDRRSRYLQGNSGSLPPFSVDGTLAVVNRLCTNWIVPPGVSAINRLDAACEVAPTGSGLTLRLFNITRNQEVGIVTIAAGSTTANNTNMTNPTLTIGDVIRFDCTAVGTTVPGASVTVQPSA